MAKIEQIEFDAHRAAKAVTRRWTERNYIGGRRAIAVREPDDRTYWFSAFPCWEYGKLAGVTNQTALRHLRKLAAAGRLVEDPRKWSGVPHFRVPRDIHDAIFAGVIAEMVAEGLEFDSSCKVVKEVSRA